MGQKCQPGINDLLTQRPELAAQWHPVKNGSLRPEDVCVFSSRRVWWQKTVQRHGREFVLEWETSVANRACGAGCPYTSNPPRKLLPGFNDLATTNPQLAELWHPTKNGAQTPDTLFAHTEQKVWWQHTVQRPDREVVHEWQASPKTVQRSTAHGGCPICCGRIVLPGDNDLLTLFPALSEEWDHSRNAAMGLTPDMVTPGSNQYVHWLCGHCGHSWKAMILNRTAARTGCPKCSHRAQTSFPEQAIYYYLKHAFPRCINRDKTALKKWELDIYLPDVHFAVEYSGLFAHASPERRAADARKRQACVKAGIDLFCIYEDSSRNEFCRNEQIIYCVPQRNYAHLSFVMACLNEELLRRGIIDQPINVHIAADEQAIRAQYQHPPAECSFALTHPQLLAQWDPVANGCLKPQSFTAGSSVSVWWQHPAADRQGAPSLHKWRAPIAKRVQGQGCPICAGKVVCVGFNDLSSLAPSFLSQWDEEKNDISPWQITAHSNKKVHWQHITAANGHTTLHRWQASPKERMRGNDCPGCAGKAVIPGINDLQTTHPQLMSEWDWAENPMRPDEISYGCAKKVWWIHSVVRAGTSFVHSWAASPNSRSNRRSGCPFCSNRKVLPGFNDLATLFPEIAGLWDNERNYPKKPNEFTAASSAKQFWLDRTHPVRISDRTKTLRQKKQ